MYTSPLNYAVEKDTPVLLNCSHKPDESGSWTFQNYSTNKAVDVFTKNKITKAFTGLFSIDESVERHFALLFNASEKTAGKYSCSDGNTSELNVYSSQVIVLGQF